MISSPESWFGSSMIATSYDSLADHYATMTMTYERFPGLEGEMSTFLSRLPGGILLDLGCGAGRDAEFAMKAGRSVVLADITPGLLRATSLRIGNPSAVRCDAASLPFRARSFAGIIASGVLLHLPKPFVYKALAEIQRVLVVGGQAAISMKHGGSDGWRVTEDFPAPRWFTYFEPEKFADSCEDAGLRVVELQVSQRKDWFTAIVART